MAKKRYPMLIVAGTIIVCFVLIGLLGRNDPGAELEKLPALMDAKGKVELTVGDFKLDKQPFIGNPNAPVTMIEFVDYKCPACKDWEQQVFPAIKEQFVDTGKVKFYVINFPFLGPDSILAASAGEAVYRQSPELFWTFKEKLYASQGKEARIWATESFLLKLAKEHLSGLDMDLFRKDLQEHTYLFDVKEDFKISAANGIYGTPSFIVNGEKVGSTLEELTQAVQRLLAAAGN